MDPALSGGSQSRLIGRQNVGCGVYWPAYRDRTDAAGFLGAHQTVCLGGGNSRCLIPAYLAPCLCNPSAEPWRRSACRAVAFGALRYFNDPDIHPRGARTPKVDSPTAPPQRVIDSDAYWRQTRVPTLMIKIAT